MATSRKAVFGASSIVILVAAFFGGWWLRGPSETRGAADNIQIGVPTIVTQAELESVAATHYPLYWAGERPDSEIELTLTSTGSAFVRYLPHGTTAGSTEKYLTIGTYYAVDGYPALAAVSEENGMTTRARNGAVIVTFNSDPLSTYFSFPSASFQVEVFSPEAGESRTLTDNGTIAIVGGVP
jgi:hypothetical protein